MAWRVTSMKRALLAAVLLATLTACGDNESGTSPSTPESTTTTTPAPTTTTTTTTTTPPPSPPTEPVVPVQPPAPKPPPVQPPPVEPPPPAEPPPAEPADAYYKNCDAARAAGAAPLHRGEPGYRAGLDRDGDGTACEAT